MQDEVPPVPAHDPLDANYHATWSQFAQWINTLLAQAPQELQALASSQGQPAESERGTSLPRVARSANRGPGCAACTTHRVPRTVASLATTAFYHSFQCLGSKPHNNLPVIA